MMKQNITSTDIRSWSMLGQRGTIFGVAIPEIAKQNEKLKVITADLMLLSGMTSFAQQFPDKFLNVGIAEQNMVGIAAGYAMAGRTVFATTYSSFIVVRSLEHVRQHVSNMKCNLKLIGTSAGCIAAKSGVSHWATEDLSFTRALPNLTILSPADAQEAYKMAHLISENEEPVYMRVSGGLNCPIVHKENVNIEIGKAIELKEGKKVALIATGLMVDNAIKAAEELEKQGISVGIYDFHTIKPIDVDMLRKIFKNYEMIATVEEHQVCGGLGSSVAEVKAGFSNTPKQIFFGFHDCFAKAGSQKFIWEQVGLMPNQICEKILCELKDIK